MSNYFDQTTFETIRSFKELRTLLFVYNYSSSLKQIPQIAEPLNSIGNAIHLHYHDLFFTLIESLLEFIDHMHQLQILRLEECNRLRSILNLQLINYTSKLKAIAKHKFKSHNPQNK
ncbi:Receptor-like protein 32 [Bienertia sinuspersici]